jgi:dTDP-4-amino-4,6-dideoxygalactose transaminase
MAAAIASFEESLPVVIPGFSFVATLRAAQLVAPGQIRVLDVDLKDWTMTPGDFPNGSRILIPVAPFGQNPLSLLEKFPDTPMVIDAAASFATFPDLSQLKSFQAVCFSLHATKIFGAGEGGFAVFGSHEWAERARSWSNFGRSGDQFGTFGSNSKMPEIQAAFCLSRLDDLQAELEDWRHSQSLAEGVTKDLGLRVQPHGFQSVHPYWTLELPSAAHRAELEQHLARVKIGSRRWWSKDLAQIFGAAPLPNSHSLAERTLGLPMFRDMQDSQAQQISQGIQESGILDWL